MTVTITLNRTLSAILGGGSRVYSFRAGAPLEIASAADVETLRIMFPEAVVSGAFAEAEPTPTLIQPDILDPWNTAARPVDTLKAKKAATERKRRRKNVGIDHDAGGGSIK